MGSLRIGFRTAGERRARDLTVICNRAGYLGVPVALGSLFASWVDTTVIWA